jgi:hypothetical protein
LNSWARCCALVLVTLSLSSHCHCLAASTRTCTRTRAPAHGYGHAQRRRYAVRARWPHAGRRPPNCERGPNSAKSIRSTRLLTRTDSDSQPARSPARRTPHKGPQSERISVARAHPARPDSSWPARVRLGRVHQRCRWLGSRVSRPGPQARSRSRRTPTRRVERGQSPAVRVTRSSSLPRRCRVSDESVTSQ